MASNAIRRRPERKRGAVTHKNKIARYARNDGLRLFQHSVGAAIDARQTRCYNVASRITHRL